MLKSPSSKAFVGASGSDCAQKLSTKVHTIFSSPVGVENVLMCEASFAHAFCIC